MSRSKLMTIGSWAFLSVSVLLAFLLGWFQWGRLVTTQQEGEAVKKHVADQEMLNLIKQKGFQDVVHQVAAAESPREGPDFVGQLRTLMLSANVHEVSTTAAAIQMLPTIGGQADAAKKDGTKPDTTKTNDATKEDKDKKALEYSLQNMPLGVVPKATNLSVKGTYTDIDRFVRLLYNYRFRTRAININSVHLKSDTNGQIEANLLLTRFVRPPDAPSLTQTDGTTPNANRAAGTAPMRN